MLKVGAVNFKAIFLVYTKIARVARYPHYRFGNRTHQQSMADGILVGEEAPRNCFVDYYHLCCISAILSGKWSSGAQFDAHSLKIAGTDGISIDSRLFPLLER